jgi:uncharacterized membrane protein (DUF485 family)
MIERPARSRLDAVARRRLIVALALTASMCAAYFGFLLLVAYRKTLLAERLAPGLSWGIAGGVAVILTAFVLTGVYVIWANRVYDRDLVDASKE